MDRNNFNFGCLTSILIIASVIIYQVPATLLSFNPLNYGITYHFGLQSVIKNEGCHQFKVVGYDEYIMTRHCKFNQLLTNGTSVNNFDYPIFAKSGQFVQLPKPIMGPATIKVFRSYQGIKQIIPKPIIINQVSNCIARYTVSNQLDYLEQGDSGAPVTQNNIVVGTQSGIDSQHIIKNNSVDKFKPIKSSSGNITFKNCS